MKSKAWQVGWLCYHLEQRLRGQSSSHTWYSSSPTLAGFLSRPLSALFVDLCLHCLDARPARSLCAPFFFFFNSVVLFWQLTCCWPLLCLDDQVHSTFLLTRRPSPWVSSWEPNHCFAEASLEQKCALCAGRAGLSCTSSSFLPL